MKTPKKGVGVIGRLTMAWAAGRDASWYRRPNTRGGKKMHVMADDGTAACNKLIPLCVKYAEPAEVVEHDQRCQRRGCKDRWPATPNVDFSGSTPLYGGESAGK